MQEVPEKAALMVLLKRGVGGSLVGGGGTISPIVGMSLTFKLSFSPDIRRFILFVFLLDLDFRCPYSTS